LFIITDYDVRLIVWNSSVGFHWLVPEYGKLTFMIFFDSFGYMFIRVFVV